MKWEILPKIFYVIDLSGVCLGTFGDRLHVANPIIRLMMPNVRILHARNNPDNGCN